MYHIKNQKIISHPDRCDKNVKCAIFWVGFWAKMDSAREEMEQNVSHQFRLHFYMSISVAKIYHRHFLPIRCVTFIVILLIWSYFTAFVAQFTAFWDLFYEALCCFLMENTSIYDMFCVVFMALYHIYVFLMIFLCFLCFFLHFFVSNLNFCVTFLFFWVQSSRFWGTFMCFYDMKFMIFMSSQYHQKTHHIYVIIT